MNKSGNPNWTKGVSGNPGGTPKGQYNLKQLCRAHTLECVRALMEIVRDKSASGRATAASSVLDRGWGKAGQEVHITQDVTPLDSLDSTALHALVTLLRQQQAIHGVHEESDTAH